MRPASASPRVRARYTSWCSPPSSPAWPPLRPGPNGKAIDAVARDAIEAAGHGEHFGHGLGHGVGLEVHEAPRLSRTAGEQPLRAGTVVTVEPGIYIPGRYGVRIEDLVAVTDGEPLVLTGLAKELTVVG